MVRGEDEVVALKITGTVYLNTFVDYWTVLWLRNEVFHLDKRALFRVKIRGWIPLDRGSQDVSWIKGWVLAGMLDFERK